MKKKKPSHNIRILAVASVLLGLLGGVISHSYMHNRQVGVDKLAKGRQAHCEYIALVLGLDADNASFKSTKTGLFGEQLAVGCHLSSGSCTSNLAFFEIRNDEDDLYRTYVDIHNAIHLYKILAREKKFKK